jgi:dTDP-4-amino-4,6-dideoxygalactose transaminase
MTRSFDQTANNIQPGAPFPAWPHHAADEIEAVSKILESGRVNYWNGDTCHQFEQAFAQFCGAKHAVALANGSVALELALIVLGIGPGDEVIVTPRSFFASVSCVVMRGAIPVFADVDPASQNLSAETIKAALTPNTKAVIAVHLAGLPCDMDPIMELSNSHGFKVIEDCAQAHGAYYKGQHVGSIGHVGTFSFCTDKIMTLGGEGGMLVTNDTDWWKHAWSYKDHGKSYDTVIDTNQSIGFRWLHESFGTNWRLTAMQAAIGLVQLGKMKDWSGQRKNNAAILAEHLEGIPAVRIEPTPLDVVHAYYKFYFFVRPEKLKTGWSRDKIMEVFAAKGLPSLVGSCSEMYLEKAFDNTEFRPQSLPNARKLGETSIMLLVHPTLTAEHMDYIGKTAGRIMREASL